MAANRYIGDYPVIGIRPTIDGRRGVLGVRESLEDQTMNMAKAAQSGPQPGAQGPFQGGQAGPQGADDQGVDEQ